MEIKVEFIHNNASNGRRTWIINNPYLFSNMSFIYAFTGKIVYSTKDSEETKIYIEVEKIKVTTKSVRIKWWSSEKKTVREEDKSTFLVNSDDFSIIITDEEICETSPTEIDMEMLW